MSNFELKHTILDSGGRFCYQFCYQIFILLPIPHKIYIKKYPIHKEKCSCFCNFESENIIS